jgi:microcystin-dependent protein
MHLPLLQMPQHSHLLNTRNVSVATNASAPVTAFAAPSWAAPGSQPWLTGAGPAATANFPQAPVPIMPAYLPLTYCIAVNGYYPVGAVGK